MAFTANVNGRRQIFVRLLRGGAPLQITKDPVDHQFPRWSPDASSLVYFSPAGTGRGPGSDLEHSRAWAARRGASSAASAAPTSAGDGRLACFRLVDGQVQLVTAALDGSDVRSSPDPPPAITAIRAGRPTAEWIAFQRGDGVRDDIFVVSARGGEPRQLTHDRNMISGLAWLPDSSGIVYGSSRGITLPYLPPLACGRCGSTGGPSRRHARRGVVRATGRARQRARCCRAAAHAVRHLEFPVRPCRGGQRARGSRSRVRPARC